MLWKKLIEAINRKESEAEVLEILKEITSEELSKVDKDGWTALHHAAFMGRDKTSKALLKIKPELANLSDKKGSLPLHLAAWKGHKNVIVMLLDVKPEIISVTNNNGQTALELAIKNNKEVAVTLLKDYHAQIMQAEEKLAQEKIAKAQKEAEIKKIFSLIAESSIKTQDIGEKNILLLGNTEAGKSTLAYLLSGRELQAIRDNQEGRMLIEATEQVAGITISHKKTSETKIPGKINTSDLTIWDCPGFVDTSGVAQEIANSFYIKKLFEFSRQMKFILVVSESSFGDRGNNLIKIVEQFCRGFTNTRCLKESLALVVTQDTNDRDAIQVSNTIKNILKDNQDISFEFREVFNYFLKSVHIFHKPKEEGIIKSEDLLKAIENSTSYLNEDQGIGFKLEQLPNIAISVESIASAKDLLEYAKNTLSSIMEVISTVLKSIDKDNVNNNIFAQHYSNIEHWLPAKKNYTKKYLSSNDETKYFVHLEQIDKICKVLNSNEIDNLELFIEQDVNNFYSAVIKLLEILEQYISNDNDQLKLQIQDYAYVFKQQLEYIDFLSKVTNEPASITEDIGVTLREWKKMMNHALTESVKNINLNDISDDEAYNDATYYKQAIEYLSKLPNDPQCLKTIAKAIENLARLAEKQGEDKEAVLGYISAIELDKTLHSCYKKLGDLLFKYSRYSEAIDCYKVNNNSTKVIKCYKKLLKIKSTANKAELKIELGDYLLSISYDKITKHYHQAFSMTEDDGLKAKAWQKIGKRLAECGEKEKAEEFIKKAIGNDFYNYNEFNVNELKAKIEQNAIEITPEKQNSKKDKLKYQEIINKLIADHIKQLQINKNLKAENEELEQKLKNNEKIFVELENIWKDCALGFDRIESNNYANIDYHDTQLFAFDSSLSDESNI